MKCLEVVNEDMHEVGAREDEVLDVVNEDMHEVGAREDEVLDMVMEDNTGGRSERR